VTPYGEPEVWTPDPVTGRWVLDPLQDGGSAREDIARGAATAFFVALVLLNVALWSFA